MKTLTRFTVQLAVIFIVLAGLFGAVSYPSTAIAATCTPTVFKDLWARTGSTTLFGTTTTTIWGYSDQDPGDASLPGPLLDVTAGDCVQVTLHNTLTVATSLLFQGQEMVPDTTGVAPGATGTYVFAASSPGTFLYEAGLLPNGQYQVAMGLYGALVVRSTTPGQAYDDPSTAYDSEAILVLSELDTALNGSAAPDTFDMRNFNPQFFLINGKAYPDTASYTVAAGSQALLRYVNAGLQAHAMSTLGLSQTTIAQDGHPYLYAHKVVAETIATGQTLDTLVSIPASAALDSIYPVYDARMRLSNDQSASLGGMLTFLTIGTTPPPGPDTTGPTVTAISLVPGRTDGTSDVTVNATLDDSLTGGANIAAAEFYIDSTAGAATAMTGAFASPVENVTGVISTATLSTLGTGSHTIFVRGQDSLGNWGQFRPITLAVDKTGPATYGLSLSPNPSSGAEAVTLTATGDDSSTGGSFVIAAEYWVDGGTHTAMTIVAGPDSPIRNFTASIPAGLSMGPHTVSVRSQDAFNTWGAIATITLQVADTQPPITSNVTASPNPNNGFQGYNTSVQAVRVFATFSDATTGGSNIAAAEGFLDTIGTTGTGFVFVASDGSFNSPTESGYADIPLAVISGLSDGNHTIYVHAKDAADNWGAMSTTILVITKNLYFSTAGNSNPPGVGGTADDSDIYYWSGTAFSRVLDVTTLGVPSGASVDGFDRVDATHFYLSFSSDTTLPGIGAVQDEDIVYYSAGTWSVYFDGTAHGLTSNALDIDAFNISGASIYFSTSGSSNPPGVSGSADDADIYAWDGASFSRVWDATAAGLAGNVNVDGLVFLDATHFYLSFSGDTALPGLGTAQDEDVVFYNNSIWIVYFDGTARGLTSNNLDIDAFDIP